MNESFRGFSHRHREGLLGAVSAGVFFVVVGTIFIITPNLLNDIIAFINNFDVIRVPNLPNIYLPAPRSPYLHSNVYTAVAQFSLIWAFFEIIMVALRFITGSPIGKKAENLSNVVFWFGTSYLIQQYLNDTTMYPTWFAFWAALLMLGGFTLIIRAIVLAAAGAMKRAA